MNKTQETSEEIIQKALDFMKEIHAKDTTGHDHFHVLRVYKMALELALNYQVDMLVVSLASILHDLDDPKISRDSSHTKTFLDQIDIPLEQKQLILEIIKNMSFSKQKDGAEVESLEGKIVQDADRLDAIGAIGIARAFAYGGSKNRPIFVGDKDDESSIAHFYQKLLKLEDLMNLSESREIAHERTLFMKEFLKQFFQEF